MTSFRQSFSTNYSVPQREWPFHGHLDQSPGQSTMHRELMTQNLGQVDVSQLPHGNYGTDFIPPAEQRTWDQSQTKSMNSVPKTPPIELSNYKMADSFPHASAAQTALLDSEYEPLVASTEFQAIMQGAIQIAANGSSEIQSNTYHDGSIDTTSSDLSTSSFDERAFDKAWAAIECQSAVNSDVGPRTEGHVQLVATYSPANYLQQDGFGNGFDSNLSVPPQHTVSAFLSSTPVSSCKEGAQMQQYCASHHQAIYTELPANTTAYPENTCAAAPAMWPSSSPTSYGQHNQNQPVAPYLSRESHVQVMGPPSTFWPTYPPMAPIPFNLVQDISTTFPSVNAQVGSTEPSCFLHEKQNVPISRASQSHHSALVTPYLGSVDSYALPSVPMPSMALPQIFHPGNSEQFHKRSVTHSAAKPTKTRSSTSAALQTPIGRSRRPRRAPKYLDFWQPPPSYSDLQREWRRKKQSTPRWEWLDASWLACPWQHRGCSFSHKIAGQMKRHGKSCHYNPHPELQQCGVCEGLGYTRKYRLADHFEMYPHHRPQEGQ